MPNLRTSPWSWGSSPRGGLLSTTEIQPSAHPPRSGMAADGQKSVICWGNFVHGCHALSWCDVSCCWSGCTLTFTLGWHTAGWKIKPCTHTHNAHLWVLEGGEVKQWGRFGRVVVFCEQKQNVPCQIRSTVAVWVRYSIQTDHLWRIWLITIRLYHNKTIFTLKVTNPISRVECAATPGWRTTQTQGDTLTVGRDLLSLRVGLALGLACPEGGLSQ